MSTDAELRNGVCTAAEARHYLITECARLMRDYERRGQQVGQLEAYLEITRDPVGRAIWDLAASGDEGGEP